MNTRILAMSLVTLVVVGASIVGTWRFASATGPDVNNDGQVRIDDIVQVVQHYYQYVPTPTPASPQVDEITIVTASGLGLAGSSGYLTTPSWHLNLDGDDFRPGTLFHLDAQLHIVSGSFCVRMIDVSTETAIPESEVCSSSPDHTFPLLSSDDFSLTGGPHEYAYQSMGVGTAYLDALRLYAVWRP